MLLRVTHLHYAEGFVENFHRKLLGVDFDVLGSASSIFYWTQIIGNMHESQEWKQFEGQKKSEGHML